jgi:hypothetical protein
MSDTEKPDWLRKHLASLPAEMSPSRDLWPGIEGRIRAPAARRWLPASIAAGVMLGVAALVLSSRVGERDHGSQPVAVVEPSPADGSDPWESARLRYSQDWPTVRDQLGPETAAVIERNLEIIHRANVDLQIALERQPDNPALRRLLRQTLAKEIEVYQQAWDATRFVAATGGASGSTHWRGTQL